MCKRFEDAGKVEICLALPCTIPQLYLEIGTRCKLGLRVKSASDAEKVARRLILEKHPKAKRILFRRVDNMGYSWLIEGEVCFKRLGFFSVKRNFKLEISVESGKATSYKEERPKKV